MNLKHVSSMIRFRCPMHSQVASKISCTLVVEPGVRPLMQKCTRGGCIAWGDALPAKAILHKSQKCQPLILNKNLKQKLTYHSCTWSDLVLFSLSLVEDEAECLLCHMFHALGIVL